jgi:hypothetical protein
VGGLIPAGVVAVFLLYWGVVGDFVTMLRGLVPWYAALHRLDLGTLLYRALAPRAPLFACAVVPYLWSRSWRRLESNCLLAATALGVILFVIQGKGWSYHRYPEVVFLCLWAATELDRSLRAGIVQRRFAVAMFAALAVLIMPFYLARELRHDSSLGIISALTRDLERLGGAGLSGSVQCLDMTLGRCINVLYRMQLVQSTGFIYDYYLFPSVPNPTTTALQKRFLGEITAKEPRVIILSSHAWPDDVSSYEQLGNWPAFRDLLQRDYAITRELPSLAPDVGYRIYSRKHSDDSQ